MTRARRAPVGGRPDEALRVAFALRQDGLEPDRACFSAYTNGKASARKSRAAPRRAAPVVRLSDVARLAAPGYERLLRLECCPETVGGGKPLKIRIQLTAPEEHQQEGVVGG